MSVHVYRLFAIHLTLTGSEVLPGRRCGLCAHRGTSPITVYTDTRRKHCKGSPSKGNRFVNQNTEPQCRSGKHYR